MNTPLLVVLPYSQKDAPAAKRLLEWIAELKGPFDHPAILLAADTLVPHDQKLELNALAKTIFTHAETMIVTAPVPKDNNYHVPAAVMFEQAMRQVDQVYKWNWLWLEPDCVPLKPGWLSLLTDAYNSQPKRFMGALIETTQPNVPKVHLAGIAIYPNCAHADLKGFCNGTKGAFDMQMASFVVPRAVNTPLLMHVWGGVDDPPKFHAVMPEKPGKNDGTLDVIRKDAVLFHRNKDGSLIDLLKKQMQANPPVHESFEKATCCELEAQHIMIGDPPGSCSGLGSQQSVQVPTAPIPPKKRMGRPPKHPVPASQEVT